MENGNGQVMGTVEVTPTQTPESNIEIPVSPENPIDVGGAEETTIPETPIEPEKEVEETTEPQEETKEVEEETKEFNPDEIDFDNMTPYDEVEGYNFGDLVREYGIDTDDQEALDEVKAYAKRLKDAGFNQEQANLFFRTFLDNVVNDMNEEKEMYTPANISKSLNEQLTIEEKRNYKPILNWIKSANANGALPQKMINDAMSNPTLVKFLNVLYSNHANSRTPIEIQKPVIKGGLSAVGAVEKYQEWNVYAHDKIGLKQVKSTQLNLENSYIKSLSDALRRNCDKVILSAISAKTGDLKKIGDQLKDITDDANVTALIKGVAYASTLVNESSVSDGRSGVAIVLDTAQYAQLFGVDKVLNSQYPSVNEIRTRNSLFGADVVKVASATKGTEKIYIIPAGTIGVASYENDIDAKAWWDDGQDSLFCRVRRSLGVAVLEPESIFEFSHKAIA